MSIPDYQSFFLPMLLLASDGNIHSIRDAIEVLSNQFNLSDEEQKALNPNGIKKPLVVIQVKYRFLYKNNTIGLKN